MFQPSGRQGSVEDNTTILEAARALGVGIESICGGRQTCAKCRVNIAEGQFAKYGVASSAANASELEPVEQRYRDERAIRSDERLACIACVRGDMVINVPPEAQAQKQVVRKSASQRTIVIDPAVRQVYVEVEPAQIGDRRADLERLQAALRDQWQLDNVSIDAKLIPTLGKVLRAGEWKATVTLWQDREVIRLRAGYAEGIVGLAVDLGTTTIAGYLCDLRTGGVLATETQMNPQIAYGEDLMSRVSYGMMNSDGVDRLHRAAIKALNEVATGAARQANLRAEDIVDLVVVGNPIMMHLLLGIDPVELGGAPFALTVRDPLDIKARELGIRVNQSAYIHVLPMQAGHVGADATAVALAEAPHSAEKLTLVVDIGTNAEILLGDRRGVYSASSPTGPAFEGAQILHGQRAAPGAIERVRIDPQTLEARFKVIGHERWSDALRPDQLHATGICGSGIIEVIAEMFLSGIIGGDGRFVVREQPHPRIQISDGGRRMAYVLATADQTATGAPIVVTQEDVRAIQLAKAALYAGIDLLRQHYRADRGENEGEIQRILLAGAFGAYIDPKYAMILGLIPDAALDQVFAVGNAAGDGARIALLNRQQRLEALTLARAINYIETATDPNFQQA
ncbi:MAG: DUF4445 domain-containing protein, partial [Anaerolineae bacterium]|nr:DUF4445 domain-containing protein [Anaerolineae bacterium]